MSDMERSELNSWASGKYYDQMKVHLVDEIQTRFNKHVI